MLSHELNCTLIFDILLQMCFSALGATLFDYVFGENVAFYSVSIIKNLCINEG